jgi:kumamolisin
MARHPLDGSERHPVAGARSVGDADPSERLEVSIMLRHNNANHFNERGRQMGTRDPSRKHLARDEFARQFGARREDIESVRKFAAAHGLAVVQEHAGRATVVLSGTVRQFNEAFDVRLQRYEHDGGSYRGRTGSVMLPDEIKDCVIAVLGLDNRPVAHPHFRRLLDRGNVRWHPASSSAQSFDPITIAELYGFPSGDGSGECVAIIELGGGYRATDLSTYFAGLDITRPPSVTAVSVDHGKNHATGDANGPDGEVMLDIEVVGSVAPGAKIVIYFAPNTDAGFIDAVTTAAHDTVNQPSVISISWGGSEDSWTQQSTTAFDAALQAAAAMGVTVCVASGDSGSSDGESSGDHVDFPASSPHVLACGGTNIQVANNAITSETVWNDGAAGGAGGGGVSTVFALPSWQGGLSIIKGGRTAPLTMRGVPDVSGDADPSSGYNVRVDGTDTVIGGTSAVAPLWAGLIARINSTRGSPVGFVNPALYAAPGVCRDIQGGNNGDFSAGPGWDACTGLGSPNGAALLAALNPSAPVA